MEQDLDRLIRKVDELLDGYSSIKTSLENFYNNVLKVDQHKTVKVINSTQFKIPKHWKKTILHPEDIVVVTVIHNGDTFSFEALVKKNNRISIPKIEIRKHLIEEGDELTLLCIKKDDVDIRNEKIDIPPKKNEVNKGGWTESEEKIDDMWE